MKEKHGENSYEFKVRVLGEFSFEDNGLIIPRPWIDRAVERDVTPMVIISFGVWTCRTVGISRH